MARLSAHGRELLRASKVIETPDNSLTLRERVTHSFRTDGHILRKSDVWFTPGPFDHGKPQFHSYGWKLWRKVKRSHDIREIAAKYHDRYREKGWTVEPIRYAR